MLVTVRPAIMGIAAASLIAGFPAVSGAETQKELNVCWVNKGRDGGVQDLEVVADGPSYRTASLDTGDCVAWDVRPGQYKLTLEDVDEFLDAADRNCGSGWDRQVLIKIRRQQEVYKIHGAQALKNGSVTTTVRNERRTTVSVVLTCVEEDNP